MSPARPWAGRGAVALVAGATLVLYLATLSHRYSADSLCFAVDVDAPEWNRRIDPRHFLLHPLCWLWVNAWVLAGWNGKSIVPLQVLDAAAAATAVGLLYRLVLEQGRAHRPALLAAAGLAVSGGMWMYGTEAEGVAIALPVYVGLGALLLRLGPGDVRPARAFRLGVAIAVAALLYASLAFVLFPAIALLCEERDGRARRLAALGLVFATPTLPIAFVATQYRFGGDWSAMFTMLRYGEGSYGTPTWQSVPRGVYSFLRNLIVFPGLGINDATMTLWARAGAAEKTALVVTYLAVAAAAAVPPAMALRDWAHWGRGARWRALAWVAPFAVFAFWWVPSDQEFWLPVSICWFALAGVLVARRSIPWRAAAVSVGVLFAANACFVILPHRDASRNSLYQTTSVLVSRSTAADVFVTAPPQRLYLSYFGGRRAVAVDDPAKLGAEIEGARAQARDTGGRVLVFAVPFPAGERERWRATAAFDVGGDGAWAVP